MIKNVVFDIGNVLIEYSPQKLLNAFGLDTTEQKLLLKHIFASDIWLKLDKGVCSLADAIDIISREIPEYKEYVERSFTEEALDILFTEIAESVEFMRKLKRDGFKIYLLSNFSREGFDYLQKKYSFPNETDGKIISSHVGYNKPDREIYRLLLDKYSLEASETVFIDDMEQNCLGAEELGIKTIRFTGVEDAVAKFKALSK